MGIGHSRTLSPRCAPSASPDRQPPHISPTGSELSPVVNSPESARARRLQRPAMCSQEQLLLLWKPLEVSDGEGLGDDAIELHIFLRA